jgi:hypothetical protein
MTRPLAISKLNTPARQVIISETITEFGGRTASLSLGATFWGQFSPNNPSTEQTAEGDFYTRQSARFLCRFTGNLKPADRLRLRGHDYVITAISEDDAGAFLVQIERVHP